MTSDLLIRIVWTLAIIAAGLVLYYLVVRLSVRRVQVKAHTLHFAQPGIPAILYFTTPDCAPCKTIQRPALSKVQDQLGDRLQIIEVNAYEQPELAKEWGVLSVPTTFIIDAGGHPRHVNHGVTLAGKLLKQLEKFSSEEG